MVEEQIFHGPNSHRVNACAGLFFWPGGSARNAEVLVCRSVGGWVLVVPSGNSRFGLHAASRSVRTGPLDLRSSGASSLCWPTTFAHVRSVSAREILPIQRSRSAAGTHHCVSVPSQTNPRRFSAGTATRVSATAGLWACQNMCTCCGKWNAAGVCLLAQQITCLPSN